MNVFTEPSKTIPVVGEFDICVVGGSATGVFAAVRSARLGAKVALVECNGFFGGVATASLVNVWHSIFDTLGEKQVIGGLTTEVIDRLKRRDGVIMREPTNRSMYAILNTAELTIELDELVRSVGVKPFLHTWFAAPLVQDNQLIGIAVEDKSGRRAILAKYFVDATGDGDLVKRLGLPTYHREGVQPPTQCVLVRGLKEIEEKFPGFSLNKEVFNPLYPNSLKKGFLWHAPVPGSHDDTMIAGTRVFGVDVSDADQLTYAEMEGRRQVRAMTDILREHFLPPGINPLVALGARIGIRETRHACCLHTLTEREVLTGVRFPDAIANGTYRVDIHAHDKEGLLFRYLDGTEVYVTPDGSKDLGRWLPEGEIAATFYQIPYRSLVPVGATNLITAGRNIDADAGAFGATRVMVNCNQTGEAAGVAAALALRDGISVSQVDPVKLRAVLAEGGSIVL